MKDIWEMRKIIANSIELVKYEPVDKAVWDAAYECYTSIVNASAKNQDNQDEELFK